MDFGCASIDVGTGVGMTSSKHGPDAIRIGVAADEPIRVAGLASIFDQPGGNGEYELVPVIAPLKELLALHDIEYVVIDLHSAPGDLEFVEKIRTIRPDVRSIVIGPDGDDELVLNAIMAGARAYLGTVRGAGNGAQGDRRGNGGVNLGAAEAAVQGHRPLDEGSESITSALPTTAYTARTAGAGTHPRGAFDSGDRQAAGN